MAISNTGGTTALDGANGVIGRTALLAMAAGQTLPYGATGNDAGCLAMTLTWAADDANDCLAGTFVGKIGGAANTWHVVSDVQMDEAA